MLTADQIHRRKSGVGASEVGAALGLSKYKTPFQLYLEKIGEIDQSDSSLPLRFGNAVEPFILDEFEENHKVKLVRSPDTLRRGVMLCHLDGWLPGKYVVQAKTSGMASDWGEPGTDEVPEEYMLQVQSEMLLSGEEIAYIPVLFSGRTYQEYIVEFDKGLSEIIEEQVHLFWNHVQTRNPPELTTYEDVVKRYRRSSGKAIEASLEIERLANSLKHQKECMKLDKSEEAKMKEKLMKFMGEADTLLDHDGKPIITWKETKPRQDFNEAAFKEAHPDLWAQYLKPATTQRRFLLKG